MATHRVTQTAVEAVVNTTSRHRVTQTAVEVLAKRIIEPFQGALGVGGGQGIGLQVETLFAPRLLDVALTDTNGSDIDFTARTNRTGGTLHYVITDSATQPTPDQIKNGLDADGNAANTSGNTTV